MSEFLLFAVIVVLYLVAGALVGLMFDRSARFSHIFNAWNLWHELLALAFWPIVFSWLAWDRRHGHR